MRNFVLVAAAVAGLALASAPVMAEDHSTLNGCLIGNEGVQTQCALNLLLGSHKQHQHLDQTQTIGLGHRGRVDGNVQVQNGFNVSLWGSGHQNIDQTQTLNVYGDVDGVRYGNGDPIQDQGALNLNLGSSHTDQSITQTQTATVRNADDQLQAQTAANVAIGGGGNSQEVNQSQTITQLGGGDEHHGD